VTDPVTMVIMAIGGDIVPDEPRITLKPFWPIAHCVKASPTHLQLAVWSGYPMIVVRRKDWKQCPGSERAIVPLPAVFVEEERDIWK
jgi:hypothetical protein